MIEPIYRCTFCIKDVEPDYEGRCPTCDHVVFNRTNPHMPDWSRHTMDSMICKVCDRVISDKDYMNAPEQRLWHCQPIKDCNCAEFKKAQERGTDGEGYGRLIYESQPIGYLMGCEFPPIKYCPWCGRNVPKPKE